VFGVQIASSHVSSKTSIMNPQKFDRLYFQCLGNGQPCFQKFIQFEFQAIIRANIVVPMLYDLLSIYMIIGNQN